MSQIPLRLIVTLLRLLRFGGRVLRGFQKNKGLLLASAVGYNVMLSIVPLGAVILVILSHFIDQERLLETIATQIRLLIPQHTEDLMATVRGFVAERRAIGGIGFLALLIFSSISFRMLEEAMAVVFSARRSAERRSLIVSLLIPLAYIGAIGLGFLLLTTLSFILDYLADSELRVGRWSLSMSVPANLSLRSLNFLGLVALFTSFYRLMPVARVRFKRAFVGGLVAAILWQLVKVVLAWYFENLSLVNALYGSLAAVVVILLSMEAAAVVVLLGAQVIAALEINADEGIPWYAEPEHATPGLEAITRRPQGGPEDAAPSAPTTE